MALSSPLSHVKDAFWLLVWRESISCLHYVHTIVGLVFSNEKKEEEIKIGF